MDGADVECGVPAGHSPSLNRNSAAMIDHTEVHVDLTKKGQPEIQTSNSGVAYTTGEGQTAVVVQTKPDPGMKPKDFVVTSCLVIMFCNFIFGLLGYHWGSKEFKNIKCPAYQPYLTQRDKISQNLARLEASSFKILQISQNFQTILYIFDAVLTNINLTLLHLTQALYI